jgi:transcription elongation factor GreA
MGDVYLTKKGYEKLSEELEYLKNVRRREISKAIGLAREHGDLSENAEYDAAKDAQGYNEKKVSELEEKLSQVRIIEDQDIPHGEVLIGATVKLKDLDNGEELEYTLVSEEESDYEQNKIAITSPIGLGLLSHKENEEVDIKVPAGILRYKILKISRE